MELLSRCECLMRRKEMHLKQGGYTGVAKQKKGEEEENRASISDVIGKRETTNNITHTVGRPECSVVIL